jgi:prepilin-type N-terminal cleavage/methylation domain-containing protein
MKKYSATTRFKNQGGIRQGRGFSLLELLVTLVIVFVTTGAAFSLLHHTTSQSRSLQVRMNQQNNLHHCLNLILQDINSSPPGNQSITVTYDSYDIHDTSHLTIMNYADSDKKQLVSQIDWIAVPRVYEEDLVLFRREEKKDDDDAPLYIPLCTDLHAFEVELLDAEGEPDAKKAALIEIYATMYLDEYHDPYRLYTARQSWCLNRTY